MEKRRILVVDDEADIRGLARVSLEPNYEVVEARNGSEALALLESAEPDFILLDIMMPGLDGFEVCRAVRKHPKFAKITIMMLSAMNQREDMVKGYEAGANLYLTKPFDPVRLRRNIDVFFEKNTAVPTARRKSLEEVTGAAEQSGSESDTSAALLTSSSKPVASSAQAPAALASVSRLPAASASGAKPRVLAVDDDSDTCIGFIGALAGEFEVFCATDGLDAIAKITTYQPDLLIIDTMMPRMSGYQLCQSLRKNTRFSKTPILLISAKHSQKDHDYSLKIGGDAFLQKPFRPQQLLEATRHLAAHKNYRLHPKALSAEQLHELENLHETEHARKTEHQNQEQTHRDDRMNMEEFLRKYGQE